MTKSLVLDLLESESLGEVSSDLCFKRPPGDSDACKNVMANILLYPIIFLPEPGSHFVFPLGPPGPSAHSIL